MKFDKEMWKQLALIIVGVLAALFGYDVMQGDDEVTISIPEEAEEAPADEEDEEDEEDEASAPSEASTIPPAESSEEEE
jgi:hypothetical protein